MDFMCTDSNTDRLKMTINAKLDTEHRTWLFKTQSGNSSEKKGAQVGGKKKKIPHHYY